MNCVASSVQFDTRGLVGPHFIRLGEQRYVFPVSLFTLRESLMQNTRICSGPLMETVMRYRLLSPDPRASSPALPLATDRFVLRYAPWIELPVGTFLFDRTALVFHFFFLEEIRTEEGARRPSSGCQVAPITDGPRLSPFPFSRSRQPKGRRTSVSLI